MEPKFTPMWQQHTRVYLAGKSGGFDVSGCPDPVGLAATIVRDCNAHDQLVEALRDILAFPNYDCVTDPSYIEAKARAKAILASVGAA